MDFPKAVLKADREYSDLIVFEANLVLGIALSCSGTGTFADADSYFQKAWSVYKSFAACPDDDTRVNLAIGYNYHMMAYALYKSDDYSGFLQTYNNFERIAMCVEGYKIYENEKMNIFSLEEPNVKVGDVVTVKILSIDGYSKNLTVICEIVN